jgi:hypothetical protein
VTNIELKVALRSLEARVAELEKRPVVEAERKVAQVAALAEFMKAELKPESGRKMCPKCGVKPNHFFHVKTCNGKKEEKINAEKVSPS